MSACFDDFSSPPQKKNYALTTNYLLWYDSIAGKSPSAQGDEPVIPRVGTDNEWEGNPIKRFKGRRIIIPFCRFHNDTRMGLTQERGKEST